MSESKPSCAKAADGKPGTATREPTIAQLRAWKSALAPVRRMPDSLRQWYVREIHAKFKALEARHAKR